MPAGIETQQSAPGLTGGRAVAGSNPVSPTRESPDFIGALCFSDALSWVRGVQVRVQFPWGTSVCSRDIGVVDGQLSFGDELRGRDEVLVAGEVAELLRVTPAWVYAETRANRLPHVRLGRYVRYRKSAILAWLDAEEKRIAREPRG